MKEANKDGYVDVVQLEYNLLHRENEEVMAYAAENNITFVPYFPLASGILAGKYDEDQTFNDHRATRRDFQPEVFKDNVRRVKELTDIAEAHNIHCECRTSILLNTSITRRCNSRCQTC